MSELNYDYIDGYLYLVDIDRLREPFRKDKELQQKYAKGFSYNKLRIQQLKIAYSHQSYKLSNWLNKLVTDCMAYLESQFIYGDFDFQLDNNITLDNMYRFINVCQNELSREQFSSKCDAIIDYFNLKIDRDCKDMLRILVVGESSRLHYLGLWNEKKNLRDEIKEFDDRLALIKAENSEKEDALIRKDTKIEEYRNKINIYNNEITSLKKQVKVISAEKDKVLQKYQLLKKTEEYSDIYFNSEEAVSFCVYGIHKDHNNEKEYRVAYRLADIYDNELVPKQDGKKFISFKNHYSIPSSGCAIYSFEKETGYVISEYENIEINEIVELSGFTSYELNRSNIAEILVKGIQFSANPITHNFLIKVLYDKTIIALSFTRTDFDIKGDIWFYKEELEKEIPNYIVNDDFIFIQDDVIGFDSEVYRDRKYIINRKAHMERRPQAIKILTDKFLLKEFTKEVAKNNSLSKREGRGLNDIFKKALTYKNFSAMIDELGYTEHLTNLLVEIQSSEESFKDLCQSVFGQNESIRQGVKAEIEGEWKELNRARIEEVNSELESIKYEKDTLKKQINDMMLDLEAKRNMKEEYEAEINALPEMVVRQAEEASKKVSKLLSEKLLLKGLIGIDSLDKIETKQYRVCNYDTPANLTIIESDVIEAAISNLELYGYFSMNKQSYYDATYEFIHSIISNGKIPLIISPYADIISDCYSVALTGNHQNIIHIDNSITNNLYVDDLMKDCNDGVVLLRDVVGGVKEEYLTDILRGQKGNDSKPFIISSESKSLLKFSPEWIYNYVVCIDMENCMLRNKTEQDLVHAENIIRFESAKKNSIRLKGIKENYPELSAQINARLQIYNDFMMMRDSKKREVLQIIRDFDIIPLAKAIRAPELVNMFNDNINNLTGE